MEIEYGLTLEDVEAFVRFHLKHGPKLKRQPAATALSVVVGIVSGLMVALSVLLDELLTYGTWLSGCCFGVLIGLFLALLLLAWFQRKLLVSSTIRNYDNPQSRWFLAWRRLWISTDGFEITSEHQYLRNTWSTVWLIDSTEDHAFFYTTMHQAHTIPRRAFENERDFEAFIDLACQYHKGETPSPTTEVILDALPAESTGITRPPHS